MSNTTITVKFGRPDGTGVDGHLSAAVDTRPNGLNGQAGGQTSFAPGATVAILIYRTNNVTITQTGCSAGSLSMGEQATVNITEDIIFADEQESNISKPAISTPTVQWFGRSLGAVTLKPDQTTLRASSQGVAVARVSYQARADVLRLTSPASINGTTDFGIAVYIAGAAA